MKNRIKYETRKGESTTEPKPGKGKAKKPPQKAPVKPEE